MYQILRRKSYIFSCSFAPETPHHYVFDCLDYQDHYIEIYSALVSTFYLYILMAIGLMT